MDGKYVLYLKYVYEAVYRNPTIFNAILWVTGLIISSTKGMRSKYYFDKLKIKHWVAGLDLGHSRLFILVFVRFFKKGKKKQN